MIPRYSTAIMETIWETETKYKIWLEIEILACEAMEKIGKVPEGTSKNIRKKAEEKMAIARENNDIEKITEYRYNIKQLALKGQLSKQTREYIKEKYYYLVK